MYELHSGLRGTCNLLALARGASVCPRTVKEGRGLTRGFKEFREIEFCLLWLLERKAVFMPKHGWDKSPNQEKWQDCTRGRRREIRVKAFLVSLEVDA